MTKLAIVTPYGLFNYGNRLQNWAVDVNLRSRGFQPETLILRKKYQKSVPLDIAREAVHRIGLRGIDSQRYQRFWDFDRTIVKRRVYSESSVRRIQESYAGIVIGSDQIWNPYQIDYGGAEFGAGFSRRSAIALSASFGIDAYPLERSAFAASRLSEIAQISVRETAGRAIVNRLTGRDAQVLCDPVLSLDADVWRRRGSVAKAPERAFGFVYMLGKYDPSVSKNVDDIIQSDGAEVVRFNNREASKYYTAGPQDFVGLIAESRMVVTDSYHALLFGLLFEKPVYVVERNDKKYSMSSRFETLTSLLGIEFGVARDIGGVPLRSVDSENFYTRLSVQREEFHDFLDVALSAVAGSADCGGSR